MLAPQVVSLHRGLGSTTTFRVWGVNCELHSIQTCRSYSKFDATLVVGVDTCSLVLLQL